MGPGAGGGKGEVRSDLFAGVQNHARCAKFRGPDREPKDHTGRLQPLPELPSGPGTKAGQETALSLLLSKPLLIHDFPGKLRQLDVWLQDLRPVRADLRARVRIDETKLTNVPSDFRLIPGMTLSAEIVVGQRSVMSYLAWPLTKGMSEAVREP